MLSPLAAVALGVAGVGCLYGSWKEHLSARLHPTLIGWLLLMTAGYFAVRATGAEFGTVWICFAPALVAWILVAINSEVREAKVRKRKNVERAEPTAIVDSRSWPQHLLLFLITVPLSALAAVFISVAISRVLPWHEITNAVSVFIMVPILWGCAAYWAVADSKLLRPAASIVVIGLIGAAGALL